MRNMVQTSLKAKLTLCLLLLGADALGMHQHGRAKRFAQVARLITTEHFGKILGNIDFPLAYPEFTNLDGKNLAEAIKKHNELQSLEMKYTQISPSTINELLLVIGGHPTLKKLNLEAFNIDEVIDDISQFLRSDKTLLALGLRDTNLTDETIKKITEALWHNKTLTTLDIGHNKIGYDGADYIAQMLEKNDSLTSIFLDKTTIKAGGIASLIESLKKNKTLLNLKLPNHTETDQARAIEGLLERNKAFAQQKEIDESYAAKQAKEENPSGTNQDGIEMDINLVDKGIGGLGAQMDVLVESVLLPLMAKSMFKLYDVKPVKGVLLYGPPGTGKTLLASKIANMVTDATIKIVNGPELSNMWVGETERNIRDLFNGAKKEPNKPYIIIFDEIDAIGQARGGDGGRHDDRALTQLLTCMNGLTSSENILVIGITNRILSLDPALIRPERLDVHIEIPLPDRNGLEEIFDIYLRSLRESGLLSGDVDISRLVEKLAGGSGATVKAVVASAKQRAVKRNFVKEGGKIRLSTSENSGTSLVTHEDLESAIIQLSSIARPNANE